MEALDAGLAPFGVGAQDDLGVAVGEEAVAEALQHRAQLGVVVDRAVEDQRQAEFGIDHRLARAFGQIDDRQAAVAEGGRAIGPLARGVGPAPRQTRVHALDDGRIGPAAVESQFTCDAAHGMLR